MKSTAFLDTNIFFYAQDSRFPDKQSKARKWIRHLAADGTGVSNLQVINEFTNSVLKRMPELPPAEVFAMADGVGLFGKTPISMTEVVAARALHGAIGYSWWDCLLLASALELGCSHFLSEDLQDGHRIGPLIVINPFRHHPSEFFGASGT